VLAVEGFLLFGVLLEIVQLHRFEGAVLEELEVTLPGRVIGPPAITGTALAPDPEQSAVVLIGGRGR
jgi:hypothetical protein